MLRGIYMTKINWVAVYYLEFEGFNLFIEININ